MIIDSINSVSNDEIVDDYPLNVETQVMQIEDQAGYPVLKLDADDYRKYVQDMGLSRRQEDELLESLWAVIVGFIDLGFSVNTKSRLQVSLEKMRKAEGGVKGHSSKTDSTGEGNDTPANVRKRRKV